MFLEKWTEIPSSKTRDTKVFFVVTFLNVDKDENDIQ